LSIVIDNNNRKKSIERSGSMTENQKELKKEILKALIDKEWSATDLANAMGISRVYMNDLINGRRISVVRMEQIKKILGIS
jgi:hypothetical protein